jgi:SAM-dependent methyltransferase
MADAIHELYRKQVYPPMSHPVSDPAVSAVAAKMGGLDVPHPRRARILEIGCCSGHNLIPLAQRWPESHFTGIDLAERSITEARERSAAVGLGNIDFHAVDLMDFAPADGPFDFIIAHGFFSWVPDEVKATLLLFCRKHLSSTGIATISFNLECGWEPRLPVIAKVRAIQQVGGGDEMSALEILKTITDPSDPASAVIEDMLGRGPSILAFDDFSPVNDPWSLDHFVNAAENAGLRWLGESDPAGNIPSELSDGFLLELRNQIQDRLAFQSAVDQALGRTFRSGVLCRGDAPVVERVSLEKMLEFSLRAGDPPIDSAAKEIFQVIRGFAPASILAEKWLSLLPDHEARSVVKLIFDGITRGWLRPRIEPVRYDAGPPEFPCLDAFRLLCARGNLPLVDAWHQPCAFPAAHYQVLAAMDGRLSLSELAELSVTRCPDLNFGPWIAHLAERGMFS